MMFTEAEIIERDAKLKHMEEVIEAYEEKGAMPAENDEDGNRVLKIHVRAVPDTEEEYEEPVEDVLKRKEVIDSYVEFGTVPEEDDVKGKRMLKQYLDYGVVPRLLDSVPGKSALKRTRSEVCDVATEESEVDDDPDVIVCKKGDPAVFYEEVEEAKEEQQQQEQEEPVAKKPKRSVEFYQRQARVHAERLNELEGKFVVEPEVKALICQLAAAYEKLHEFCMEGEIYDLPPECADPDDFGFYTRAAKDVAEEWFEPAVHAVDLTAEDDE